MAGNRNMRGILGRVLFFGTVAVLLVTASASHGVEMWGTDGTVDAIARTPQAVYLGGSFTMVGPYTGRGVPVELGTGQVVSQYPKVNAQINVSIPDGSGGWYIGGTFTRVGTLERNRIAHILPDGGVDPLWNPNVEGSYTYVKALALSGTTLYVGGDFYKIGGQTRSNFAALDASTGAVTGLNVSVNRTVYALAVSGSTVYLGGDFWTIGSANRNRIGAINAATGLATSWAPQATSTVNTLVISGTTIYAGGSFDTIGGQTRHFLAALDNATGLATGWDPNPNGVIYAIEISGTTVYVGGAFTTIGGQSRNYLAGLDAATGLATAWNPSPDNSVRALEVSGTTLYAGGAFMNAGGQPRCRVAALDTGTGLATTWNPCASFDVYTLAIWGSTAYVGGSFTIVGGVVRNRLAALDAATGVATAWDPNPNAGVCALEISGSTIYVGGDFTSIGGQPRSRIAALDLATGLATGWAPNAGGTNSRVLTLNASGLAVYAGGVFTSIGGQARNNIAAIDAGTGLAMAWNPNSDGKISVLAVSGSTVYVGGVFTNIGGAPRNNIAALEASTGLATGWSPNAGGSDPSVSDLVISDSVIYAGGAFTSIGGQPRNHIAAIDVATGLATSWNPNADGSVYCLALSGSRVYAGGTFSMLGGQARNCIAAVDATTGLAAAWKPDANNWVTSLCAADTSLYIGGMFTAIGGQDWVRFAEIETNAFAVSPAEGFSSSGLAGGPFTPSSIAYTLINFSPSSISWTAAATQPWLTLDVTNGVLAPGASAVVTIALNAAAESLGEETHTDGVTFTDVTNDYSVTRKVTLEITGPLAVTPSIGLTSVGDPGGPFAPDSATYTVTNTGLADTSWTATVTQPWVTVSPSGGLLSPGASIPVTISLNATANELPLGHYTDSLTITSEATGHPFLRPITLWVRLAGVWFVDGLSTSSTHDGRSWHTPFVTLEEAVSAAQAGEQIWVASGTYQPASALTLGENIELYGGFARTETSLNERNWLLNVTLLEPAEVISEEPWGGFSCENGSLFDGFRIENLNRTRSLVYANGAEIAHCTFTGNDGYGDNDAGEIKGTAIYAENSNIHDCVFTDNVAQALNGTYGLPYGDNGGQAYGAAIYGIGCSISHCVFTNNRCIGGDGEYGTSKGGAGGNAYGGAIYLDGGAISDSAFRDCMVLGGAGGFGMDQNAEGGGGGSGFGGAVYLKTGVITLSNCTFVGCSAHAGHSGTPYGAYLYDGFAYGGGVYGSTFALMNCSFNGNGVYPSIGESPGYGGAAIAGNTVTICNSIVTETSPLSISGLTCTYSDIVAGGVTGVGVISANPQFVSATDLRLQAGSPCIDTGTAAGAPNADLDGIARPVDIPLTGANATGTEYDMGAHEAHFPMPISVVPTGALLTNTVSVDFLVTFSGPVSGVDTTDFAVLGAGLIGASVAGVSSVDDSVYTVTVTTGSGDGTIGLSLVDNDSIVSTDGSPLGGTNTGNGSITGPSTYLIDRTAPTGTIAIDDGAAYTSSAGVTLTMFAEDGAGSGVTLMRFSEDGISWEDWQTFGGEQSRTLTGGDGSKTIWAQYQDAAGNISASPSSASIILDTVSPTPTITGLTTLTNAVRMLTIDFGEAVDGFSLSGVVVTNGTATNLHPVGPASSYTVDILGNSEATVSVSVPAGVATDLAGHPSMCAVESLSYPFDAIAPTAEITLSGNTPTAADAVEYTVTFSEILATPLTESNVILVPGSLSGTVMVSGTGSGYTVQVTLADVDADGTVAISVSGIGLNDLAGNVYGGDSSLSYTIENWHGLTTYPQDTRAYEGDTVVLEVGGVFGLITPTFQWKWNSLSKAIQNGPMGTTWTLPNVTADNNGMYWCSILFDGNPYSSDIATLTVQPHITISSPPVGGECRAGDSMTFTVEASGGYPPFTYAWKDKHGNVIPNADEPTYITPPLTSGDTGTYTVEVSDTNGDQKEASFELTVKEALPLSGTACAITLLALLCIGALRARRIKSD